MFDLYSHDHRITKTKENALNLMWGTTGLLQMSKTYFLSEYKWFHIGEEELSFFFIGIVEWLQLVSR